MSGAGFQGRGPVPRGRNLRGMGPEGVAGIRNPQPNFNQPRRDGHAPSQDFWFEHPGPTPWQQNEFHHPPLQYPYDYRFQRGRSQYCSSIAARGRSKRIRGDGRPRGMYQPPGGYQMSMARPPQPEAAKFAPLGSEEERQQKIAETADKLKQKLSSLTVEKPVNFWDENLAGVAFASDDQEQHLISNRGIPELRHDPPELNLTVGDFKDIGRVDPEGFTNSTEPQDVTIVGKESEEREEAGSIDSEIYLIDNDEASGNGTEITGRSKETEKQNPAPEPPEPSENESSKPEEKEMRVNHNPELSESLEKLRKVIKNDRKLEKEGRAAALLLDNRPVFKPSLDFRPEINHPYARFQEHGNNSGESREPRRDREREQPREQFREQSRFREQFWPDYQRDGPNPQGNFGPDFNRYDPGQRNFRPQGPRMNHSEFDGPPRMNRPPMIDHCNMGYENRPPQRFDNFRQDQSRNHSWYNHDDAVLQPPPAFDPRGPPLPRFMNQEQEPIYAPVLPMSYGQQMPHMHIGPGPFVPIVNGNFNHIMQPPNTAPCIIPEFLPRITKNIDSQTALQPPPPPPPVVPLEEISLPTVGETNKTVPTPMNMNEELEDMQEALEFAKKLMNMTDEEAELVQSLNMPTFPDLPPIPSTEPSHLVDQPEEEQVAEASKEKPKVAEVTEKPEVDEAREKPKVDEAREKPKVHEAGEKPKVDEAKEKPKVAEAKEKSKADKAREQPKVAEAKEPEPGLESQILEDQTRTKVVFNVNSTSKMPSQSKQSEETAAHLKKIREKLANSTLPPLKVSKPPVEAERKERKERKKKPEEPMPQEIPAPEIPAVSKSPASSSKASKSLLASTVDANWKDKVINQFLKMSKNDICNMVNSSGLRKFDIAMKHLVKERKNALSQERRTSADDAVKGNCDMSREEFMSQLSAMLDPSATVDVKNLPAKFIQHLSEVLKLDVESHLNEAEYVTQFNNEGHQFKAQQNLAQFIPAEEILETEDRTMTPNVFGSVFAPQEIVDEPVPDMEVLDDIFSAGIARAKMGLVPRFPETSSPPVVDPEPVQQPYIRARCMKTLMNSQPEESADLRDPKSRNSDAWNRKKRQDPDLFRNLTKEEWEARCGNSRDQEPTQSRTPSSRETSLGATSRSPKPQEPKSHRPSRNRSPPTPKNSVKQTRNDSCSDFGSSLSSDGEACSQPRVNKLLKVIKDREKVAKNLTLGESMRDEVNAEMEREWETEAERKLRKREKCLRRRDRKERLEKESREEEPRIEIKLENPVLIKQEELIIETDHPTVLDTTHKSLKAKSVDKNGEISLSATLFQENNDCSNLKSREMLVAREYAGRQEALNHCFEKVDAKKAQDSVVGKKTETAVPRPKEAKIVLQKITNKPAVKKIAGKPETPETIVAKIPDKPKEAKVVLEKITSKSAAMKICSKPETQEIRENSTTGKIRTQSPVQKLKEAKIATEKVMNREAAKKNNDKLGTRENSSVSKIRTESPVQKPKETKEAPTQKISSRAAAKKIIDGSPTLEKFRTESPVEKLKETKIVVEKTANKLKNNLVSEKAQVEKSAQNHDREKAETNEAKVTGADAAASTAGTKRIDITVYKARKLQRNFGQRENRTEGVKPTTESAAETKRPEAVDESTPLKGKEDSESATKTETPKESETPKVSKNENKEEEKRAKTAAEGRSTQRESERSRSREGSREKSKRVSQESSHGVKRQDKSDAKDSRPHQNNNVLESKEKKATRCDKDVESSRGTEEKIERRQTRDSKKKSEDKLKDKQSRGDSPATRSAKDKKETGSEKKKESKSMDEVQKEKGTEKNREALKQKESKSINEVQKEKEGEQTREDSKLKESKKTDEQEKQKESKSVDKVQKEAEDIVKQKDAETAEDIVKQKQTETAEESLKQKQVEKTEKIVEQEEAEKIVKQKEAEKTEESLEPKEAEKIVEQKETEKAEEILEQKEAEKSEDIVDQKKTDTDEESLKRKEVEKTENIVEQKEAEKIVEQKQTEKADETLEQKNVAEAEKILEQREAEKSEEILQQKEAEKADEIVEQKEAEQTGVIVEQREPEKTEKIVEQEETAKAETVSKQKDVEEDDKILEHKEVEKAEEILEQKEAEKDDGIVEQKEVEKTDEIVEQKEAAKTEEIVEQQESEKAKTKVKRTEAGKAENIVQQIETEKVEADVKHTDVENYREELNPNETKTDESVEVSVSQRIEDAKTTVSTKIEEALDSQEQDATESTIPEAQSNIKRLEKDSSENDAINEEQTKPRIREDESEINEETNVDDSVSTVFECSNNEVKILLNDLIEKAISQLGLLNASKNQIDVETEAAKPIEENREALLLDPEEPATQEGIDPSILRDFGVEADGSSPRTPGSPLIGFTEDTINSSILGKRKLAQSVLEITEDFVRNKRAKNFDDMMLDMIAGGASIPEEMSGQIDNLVLSDLGAGGLTPSGDTLSLGSSIDFDQGEFIVLSEISSDENFSQDGSLKPVPVVEKKAEDGEEEQPEKTEKVDVANSEVELNVCVEEKKSEECPEEETDALAEPFVETLPLPDEKVEPKTPMVETSEPPKLEPAKKESAKGVSPSRERSSSRSLHRVKHKHKTKHKKDKNRKMNEKKIKEIAKDEDIVTLVTKQQTKEVVMNRMIEIDIEIHKLMSEKMKLYHMLESGDFATEQNPTISKEKSNEIIAAKPKSSTSSKTGGSECRRDTEEKDSAAKKNKKLQRHSEPRKTASEKPADGRTSVSKKKHTDEKSKQRSSPSQGPKKNSGVKEAAFLEDVDFLEASLRGKKSEPKKKDSVRKVVKDKKDEVEDPLEPANNVLQAQQIYSDESSQLSASSLQENEKAGSRKGLKGLALLEESYKREKAISKKRKSNLSRASKKEEAKPPAKGALLSSEEDMPLDLLISKKFRKKSTKSGGVVKRTKSTEVLDHVSEVINAVAENKVEEYRSAGRERSEVQERKTKANPKGKSDPEETHGELAENLTCEDNAQNIESLENRTEEEARILVESEDASRSDLTESLAHMNYDDIPDIDEAFVKIEIEKPHELPQPVVEIHNCETGAVHVPSTSGLKRGKRKRRVSWDEGRVSKRASGVKSELKSCSVRLIDCKYTLLRSFKEAIKPPPLLGGDMQALSRSGFFDSDPELRRSEEYDENDLEIMRIHAMSLPQEDDEVVQDFCSLEPESLRTLDETEVDQELMDVALDSGTRDACAEIATGVIPVFEEPEEIEEPVSEIIELESVDTGEGEGELLMADEGELLMAEDDDPVVARDPSDEETDEVQEVELPKVQYSVHKGPILDVKVFGDSILAASEDGVIYRYSQTCNGILNTYEGHKTAVTCIYVLPSVLTSGTTRDLLFSGSLDGSLRCYDITTSVQVRGAADVGSPIQCMDQSWGMIYLGTKSGYVFRFHIKSHTFKGDEIKFSEESVLALKATTEGPRRVLIVASRSQPITIRDAKDGLFLRTLSGQKTHTVYSLMMDSNLVYCGTSSTAIPVFDFISGSQTKMYNAGPGVVCMKMYKWLLFAGCYDGNIYVFDTKEQRLVCSIPGPGNMLLSMDIVKNKIVAGSKDRRLHMWRMPKQVLSLLSKNNQ